MNGWLGDKEPLGRRPPTRRIFPRLIESTDVSKESAFLDGGPTVREGSYFIRVSSWEVGSQPGGEKVRKRGFVKMSVHRVMTVREEKGK